MCVGEAAAVHQVCHAPWSYFSILITGWYGKRIIYFYHYYKFWLTRFVFQPEARTPKGIPRARVLTTSYSQQLALPSLRYIAHTQQVQGTRLHAPATILPVTPQRAPYSRKEEDAWLGSQRHLELERARARNTNICFLGKLSLPVRESRETIFLYFRVSQTWVQIQRYYFLWRSLG